MPDPILDIVTDPLVDADDIAHRFIALEQAIPEGDGVRWFCTAHVAMSIAVAEAVLAHDFEDPVLLEQIDLNLVAAFFTEVANDRLDNDIRRSWRPLFERRHDDAVSPLRFALAGINAHIATDLARSVLITCREAGIEPSRDTPLYRDYCEINDMETALRTKVEEQVFGPLMQATDDALGPVDDVLATFAFSAAREAAWINADVAHELPRPLADIHLAALDRTTGFVNRVMLLG